MCLQLNLGLARSVFKGTVEGVITAFFLHFFAVLILAVKHWMIEEFSPFLIMQKLYRTSNKFACLYPIKHLPSLSIALLFTGNPTCKSWLIVSDT